MVETEDSSYIDYETFLDPDFSPTSFANTLVLATNNPSDAQLDLNTPLSRVLFDVQEIDTHIDSLTTSNAIPLLNHTKGDIEAGGRILGELETQVAGLTESYGRLERDVIQRHAEADQTRVAAERLLQTVRLGRTVTRCLTLSRQLEAQMGEMPGSVAAPGAKKEDFRVLVRASNSVLALHQILQMDSHGDDLGKINIIKTLQTELIQPAEKRILSRAEQVVSQFSMSTLSTPNNDAPSNDGGFNSVLPQQDDTGSRATSALQTLYLLSPLPSDLSDFEPTRLVSVLQEYLRRAITSSLAGLTGALSALPKLERTLLEVSARCQNIVALEMLLDSIQPPSHPLLGDQTAVDQPLGTGTDSRPATAYPNLLQPLLSSLDTSSLPSYFWRSMASQLSSRVQKILRDGGVSARTLRSNKERVRDAIRECVSRGSQLPTGSFARSGGNKPTVVRNWEREAAVMVGSVINVLGR
ncbi:MAG: hypothetical protein M1828_003790 [Chrysothrix sp. TS-e1954]|nr:MAG: hypothetical protein M1828_003790 [Chrysothrix sp. TS-e1954]